MKEKGEKLQGLVESIAANLETFSCEIVNCKEGGGGGQYVKIRNCRSNTFSFSSSLFAVLRPLEGNVKAAIYTYNEEELETEFLTWNTDVICNFLADRLGVGNYTFCCGIVEENLVKMDLKFFEIKDTLFEKFGARAVFRSRHCRRVFNREVATLGRQSEATSLCPSCRAWVQAIMDRMLEEGTADTQKGTDDASDCKNVEGVQESASQTEEVIGRLFGRDGAQGFVESGSGLRGGFGPKVGRTCVVIEVEDRELVCLDGEVEQEFARMQGGPNPKDIAPAFSVDLVPKSRKTGRTTHPCPHLGCDFVGRSVTVLRYHMPTHTGEANFCCQTCGRKFKHKKELSLCEKRHQGRYDHACKDCDKKFLSKKKLDMHIRVHTGEKPFSCPFCEHRCARRDNLNSHIKKNHKESGHGAEKLFLQTGGKEESLRGAILTSVITRSDDSLQTPS